MEKLDKKVRVQFTIIELRIIRNALVNDYHRDRRNLRYKKNAVAHGEPDSRFYAIEPRERNLKFLRRLLKKVSKYTGIKWSER